jgi:hypothetical protein
MSIDGLVLPPVRWPDAKDYDPPVALYLSGFKRTGKDELANGISDLWSPVPYKYHWDAYASNRDTSPSVITSFAGAVIVGFHDKLRKEVYKWRGLPRDYNYEANKDVICSETGRSLRDDMIAVGAAGRAIDPAYWVKRAFAGYFSCKTASRAKLICPDHRFRAEYESAVAVGMKVVTARLYRSEVPVPPADIESEHDLDSFATDFLLVRDEAEFAKAVKQFGNCQDVGTYRKVGTLF